MPTLVANAALADSLNPAVSSPPPPPPPHIGVPPSMTTTSLMLSCNGVQFHLTPTDPTRSQISFKANAQGIIILDLENFSGSLQVSPVTPTSTTTTPLPATTNATTPSPRASSSSSSPKKVEQEEPNSPEHVQPSLLLLSNTVTPGQQKLGFYKNPKKSLGTKKKRTMDIAKRGIVKKTKKEPLSLAQSTMEIPTQGVDMSQSMPSSNSDARSSSPDDDELVVMMVTEPEEPKETVQQILDRVNSTNSVVGDDAEEHDNHDNHKNENNEPKAMEIPIMEMESSKPVTETSALDVALSNNSYPPPCPRWGHTMTNLKNDRLLVYGGQSFDGTGSPIILSDVHVYHPKKKSWEKPINCRGEARQWHSVTFLPERQLLLAFGGETYDLFGTKKDKIVTSDSLKVLDTEIMLWYPPAVSGDVPSGRSGHTATLLPSTNEVVLFGGVRGSKWLNTVTVLDSVRWIWSVPKIQGAAPKPRSYHTTTAVKSSNDNGYKLVVFGGNNKTSAFNTVHILEPLGEGEWKWSHPAVQGQAPFPRTGHSATLMEDGKTICIYGGWDPNEEGEQEGEENIFKTSFLLDTETWTWNKGPKALPGGSGTDRSMEDCGPKRCGHTATIHPETGEVLLFGGRIPGEILAGDFQRLSSPAEK